MFRPLIIVLALVVVTNAIPLPASMQQPERNVRRRSSAQEAPQVELGNTSAPAYIKDLFTNITKSSEQQGQTKAPSNDDLVNAVRSFPNLVLGHCGQLGFNISIISSTEFVVKAELRVRVNRDGLRGAVKAVLLHKNGTRITDRPVTEDWIEFSMNTVVANWARQERRKQHDFRIELHSTGTDPIPNGCSHIMTESADRDQQPLLVVYSIEPNYEDIPIIKGIKQMMNQTRSKRSINTVPTPPPENLVKIDGGCRKHNVEEINTEWLNANVNFVTNGKIIGLTKFQVGVCGGGCERTVPESPAHAIMFHLMATSGTNRRAHLRAPGQYTRCCVPLEYNDGSFVMQQGEGQQAVFTMWKLKKASVRKCGCIYYKHQMIASSN